MGAIAEVRLRYSSDSDAELRGICGDFNVTARWLMWLYADGLRPFAAPNVRLLVVSLYDPRLAAPPIDAGVDPTDRIGVVGHAVQTAQPSGTDLMVLLGMDKKTRKRIQLDELQEGMLRIARKMGWPESPFRASYARCLERQLEDRRLFGRPKSNPSRTLRAACSSLIDSDWVQIYVTVAGPDNIEVQRWTLMKRTPLDGGPFFPYYELGNFKWLNNSTMRLTSRGGKRHWEVTVGDPAVRFSGPADEP